MAAIAALLDGRAALATLRRSLPRSVRLYRCRQERDLEPTLHRYLIDVLVLGTWVARRMDLPQFRSRYPTIPLALMGSVRPEDGPALAAWSGLGAVLILVEGVDDAVMGELILRHGAAGRRALLRSDLPGKLRLTEPLQRRAWDRLARSPGRPPASSNLARQLGVSREHLSRQFGAGGAPNLKRVSDFLTVQVALELLENPGYDRFTVARLLEFSSPSHLSAVLRRLTGLSLAEARAAEWRELVGRFLARQ